MPDGVFNVVHGDKVAVDAILEHPDIAAVSFVGSTPIARYIYETGTKHGKRVQALGGAKNHMVVLPDADVDMAADAAVSAAYGSAGERCMAISVVVAVGDAADPLVDAIEERLPKIKVGPGSEEGVGDGAADHPRASRQGGRSYLDSGRGRRHLASTAASTPSTKDDGGFFLGVILLDNVTPEMDCYRNEIFGPVLEIVRVPTYAEAVEVIEREPVRQRHRDLHAGRRRGAAVPVRRRTWAWSASTCRSRCRSRTTASAAGSRRCSVTCTCTGPEGIQFYTRGKVVTARWPDPGTSQGRPGLPAHPMTSTTARAPAAGPGRPAAGQPGPRCPADRRRGGAHRARRRRFSSSCRSRRCRSRSRRSPSFCPAPRWDPGAARAAMLLYRRRRGMGLAGSRRAAPASPSVLRVHRWLRRGGRRSSARWHGAGLTAASWAPSALMVVGNLVIYAIGLPWLMVALGVDLSKGAGVRGHAVPHRRRAEDRAGRRAAAGNLASGRRRLRR